MDGGAVRPDSTTIHSTEGVDMTDLTIDIGIDEADRQATADLLTEDRLDVAQPARLNER
jgi:hypothetical protein